MPENELLFFVPNRQEWAAPDYDVLSDGRLAAWGGGMFTASKSNGSMKSIQLPAASAVVAKNPWKLSFPPNWGAPAAATFSKLISRPDSPDAGIKYFSGTATYRTTIVVPSSLVGAGRGAQL